MKMNRRKALIGIGSLAVGSGAALGSGAFTQVQANRSVDIAVASDSNALLGIAASGPYAKDTDTSDNAVSLKIGAAGDNGSGVNDNATTNLGDVLTLTNQGDSSAGAVDLSFSSTGGNSVSVKISDNTTDTVVDLEMDGSPDSLPAGDTIDVLAVVKTGGQATPTDADVTDSVTLVADSV